MPLLGTRFAASITGFGGLSKLGYLLRNSLRFRSSATAFLSRTPASAGNRRTWTWSGWVKKGKLGGYQSLIAAGTTINTDLTFHTDTDNYGLDFGIYAGGGYVGRKLTSALYRDVSAWYHVVAVMDTTNATAGSRMRLYVNGVEVTTFSVSTNPSQNTDTDMNNTVAHNIGNNPASSYPFDGYLAEVNFVDGQALTPSSFGKTDPVTGQWIPIKYSGTYGTNGFYLNFTDASAATAAAIGKDFSGNGNNWTPNNISVTAGVTYDSMTDVPTLTGATAANFATLNPLSPLVSGTISNGNLTFTSGTNDAICVGTFGVSSGKWYWEVTATTVNASLSGIGIIGQPPASLTVDLRTPSNGYCYISNGNKGNNNTTSAYGATYTSGDIIGVALDMDAGTLAFYKNNSAQGTAYSSLSGVFSPAIGDLAGASGGAVFNCNFGQQPFAYTPPSGFKSLNAFNLP